MIVDTMTLKEVGETILKTVPKVIPTIFEMLERKDKNYRKIIIKGEKERYDFNPIHITTDGINFIMCPYSLGKKHYKKNGILCYLIAHVYYNNTNWYCTINYDLQSVQMYCNHFFMRYIERHVKDGSMVNVEIVRKYFKEINYLTTIYEIENYKHEDCIYAATNIGLCCGRLVSNQVYIYLTYIDRETLTIGDKRKAFDDGQKLLETVELGIKEFINVA